MVFSSKICQSRGKVEVNVNPSRLRMIPKLSKNGAVSNHLVGVGNRVWCVDGGDIESIDEPKYKKTAMQVFRFFTIIKFYAFYFSTSLGHY
jgi:hypothetical protein